MWLKAILYLRITLTGIRRKLKTRLKLLRSKIMYQVYSILGSNVSYFIMKYIIAPPIFGALFAMSIIIIVMVKILLLLYLLAVSLLRRKKSPLKLGSKASTMLINMVINRARRRVDRYFSVRSRASTIQRHRQNRRLEQALLVKEMLQLVSKYEEEGNIEEGITTALERLVEIENPFPETTLFVDTLILLLATRNAGMERQNEQQ